MKYERLCEQLDLVGIANNRYGLRWPKADRPVQIHCPMHDDRTPSARLYPENNGWCWTCQRVIDPVSLVATREGVSYVAAAEMLERWYGVSNDPDPDDEEVRELLGRALRGPVVDSDPRRERMAAAMARRAVGRPWEQARELIRAWDLLDLTDIDPREWLSSTSEDGRLALG